MSSRTVSTKKINTCGEIDLTRKFAPEQIKLENTFRSPSISISIDFILIVSFVISINNFV